MRMSLLDQIEASFPNLSRQERKLALLVTQHPDRVQEMHIAALAKKAGVGTATVTRFAKKMGCADFSTFKVQLAAAQGVQVPPPDTGTAGDRVYSIYSKMLQGTWAHIDMNRLEQIVQVISNARRVYVYGQGSSGYSAEEFSQRLIRMGIDTLCTTDTHMMFINGSLMSAADAIVVLSNSGNSSDVNAAAEMGKNNGARVIAITAFSQSPLADLADFSVIVKSVSFVEDMRFVNSQFSSMYVLDILTTMLLENPTYQRRLKSTVDLIMMRKLKHE